MYFVRFARHLGTFEWWNGPLKWECFNLLNFAALHIVCIPRHPTPSHPSFFKAQACDRSRWLRRKSPDNERGGRTIIKCCPLLSIGPFPDSKDPVRHHRDDMSTRGSMAGLGTSSRKFPRPGPGSSTSSGVHINDDIKC